MTLDETVRAAECMAAGVREMHKQIRNLEAQVKRIRTRAEHYRALTLAQTKEITRLKKGLKP